MEHHKLMMQTGGSDGLVVFANFLASSTLPAWLGHSRASAATLIDGTGALTWAPENLFLNSVLAGAVAGTPGTAPTSWAYSSSAGSLTTEADPVYGGNLVGYTAAAARHYSSQSVTIEAGATVQIAVRINNVGASIVLGRIFSINPTPAGGTVTYYLDGNVVTPGITNVTAGEHVIFAKVVLAGTGGAVGLRIGIGCDSSATGTVKFYAPQAQRITHEATLSSYNATTGAAFYGPAFDYELLTAVAYGLRAESARTNVVLWDRDMTNAAWTKTNITAAKDQTGISGVANTASSLTATAGNGTCLQAIVLASSARFQSAYVKRITGSGVVEMTTDNGTTWTAITVTANWTRVSIPTQTLANPTVGFRIVTSGDAIAVDFVQNENGAFATSPLYTATAAAARSADALSMLSYGTNPSIVQVRDIQTGVRSRQVVDPASGISALSNVWVERVEIYQ